MDNHNSRVQPLLKKATSGTKVFIDTSSLLEDGYKTLEPELFKAIEDAGEKLIVPMSVIKELKEKSMSDDPKLSEKANYAMNSLAKWQSRNLVVIRGEATDNKLADNVFMVQFTKFRDQYNLALIAQDKGLARDIKNLNLLTCQRSRYKISVYRISGSGVLWENDGVKYNGTQQNNTWMSPRRQENKMEQKPLFSLKTQISSIPDVPIKVKQIPGVNDSVYAAIGKKYIKLVSELGKGGEAITYETSEKGMVCKIYRPEKLTRHRIEKLGKMIGCDFDCPGVCWPVDTVLNRENMVVGYLMPRAEGFELQRSVFIPPLLRQKFPTWTRIELVKLAISILDKIEYLHRNNIIMGDINPANILVKNENEVYFVDTDSYQIEEFHCPVGTPYFTAPELQTRKDYDYLRTMGNESFAISTLLFMIMLPGKSPYAQQDGEDARTNIQKMNFSYPLGEKSNKKTPNGPWRFCWSHLPFKIKEAFYESFRSEGSRSKEEFRLKVSEWKDLFFNDYLLKFEKFKQQDPECVKIFPQRFKYVGGGALVKCKMCGTEYPEDDLNKGYCNNCLRDGVEKPCEKCGKPILYTNYRKLIQKKPPYNICSDCYQKLADVYENRTCVDCGRDFTITNGEQEYYQSHGLFLPKRCPTCRKAAHDTSSSGFNDSPEKQKSGFLGEIFKSLFKWR